MQFCDFENLRDNGADAELKRLCNLGFLSAEDGKRVRLHEIEMFRQSSLFADMLKAKNIYRELRFNVRLPATEFTEKDEKAEAYRDREILVQGVIDCIIEKSDGSISIYDYKTDRLTLEELSDRSLAEKKLREKHSTQLGLYAMAVEKIFEKKPESIEVYSLALGDTVSMK
jgi:ATP-dependent helicase/nuclease subunit A